MGCITVSIAACLFLLLGSAAATLIISHPDGSDAASFSGSYLVFGIFPFDITANVELLIEYDACDPLPVDLSGKIAVVNASKICTTTVHDQNYISPRAHHVKNANAQVK